MTEWVAEFDGSDDTPLYELREWVEDNKDEGAICPCCDQFAKIYKRPMDSGQAHDLIRLYRAGGADDYVHFTREVNGGGLAKLRYWGLVDDGGERDGTWKVTEEGVKFVKRSIYVPKRVIIYDDRLLGFDVSEWITIVDALADKFDYGKLMSL